MPIRFHGLLPVVSWRSGSTETGAPSVGSDATRWRARCRPRRPRPRFRRGGEAEDRCARASGRGSPPLRFDGCGCLSARDGQAYTSPRPVAIDSERARWRMSPGGRPRAHVQRGVMRWTGHGRSAPSPGTTDNGAGPLVPERTPPHERIWVGVSPPKTSASHRPVGRPRAERVGGRVERPPADEARGPAPGTPSRGSIRAVPGCRTTARPQPP